jgi:hypothetical protein
VSANIFCWHPAVPKLFTSGQTGEKIQKKLLVKKRNSTLLKILHLPISFHQKHTNFENHISVKICENISFSMPSAGKVYAKDYLKSLFLFFFIRSGTDTAAADVPGRLLFYSCL